MSDKPELKRFIGLVLALLIPSFVLWMLISPWLAGPAVLLVDVILTAWMPEVVAEVQLRGAEALTVTQFGELDGRVVSINIAEFQLAYPTDVRVLSYSIAFYAALTFAMPQSDNFSRFGWGLWFLYPLIVLGLVFVILKDLMLGLGPILFEQDIPFLPNQHVIGMFYQMSILIIPPVAPMVIWAWQSRDSPFLQKLASINSAPEAEKPSQLTPK
ncbi:MAG: exosortase H-associated membrane protein [Halioglobus sp.]